MWTITFRRFKRDRRGVSNIIVVVLSFVIILAIVSNIVLWNYEMNQVDWEKMKEEASITNVEQVTTYSSWNVLQEEFTVNLGSQSGGTYVNTQTIDDTYESFTEAGESSSSNVTLVDEESFEGNWPPNGWSETGRWNKEGNQEYDGSYSADFDGGNGRSGTLTTLDLDCSDADSIFVDFWYRDDGSESGEFMLQYFDGNTWDTVADLGATSSENQWLHYQDEITDNQYFKSDFKIRWSTATNHNSDDVYVDLVTLKKLADSSSYLLDLTGRLNIDVTAYSVENIQTVELQLRYRTDDSAEVWYLKAYDWTTSEYSNLGFNFTSGHNPTTGWDYYTLNLTNAWQNYVNSNGTILVKFLDQGADVDQTSVDIDFLGVRLKAEGTQFTIKNDGALTLHLVSLWIINSTHHERYDIHAFVNSAATKNYINFDISIPASDYMVKFVTERGNVAVYSETST